MPSVAMSPSFFESVTVFHVYMNFSFKEYFVDSPSIFMSHFPPRHSTEVVEIYCSSEVLFSYTRVHLDLMLLSLNTCLERSLSSLSSAVLFSSMGLGVGCCVQ